LPPILDDASQCETHRTPDVILLVFLVSFSCFYFLLKGDDTLNLEGSIPLELTLMTHLRLLDFSNSPFLVGTLPSQSLLHHVEALYVQHTAMTGLWADRPSSLDFAGKNGNTTTTTTAATSGNTTFALIDLRLSAQQGPLDSSTVTLLRNLKWLEWKKWRWHSSSSNDDDILPTSINLTTSATIPTEIGYLTGLQGLLLNGNGFSGDVPVELAKLTSLVSLDLCKLVP
jgi:hypothetical protein